MTINYFSITDFRFSVIGYSWWYTVHFYYHPLIKKRKHMSHSNPVFVPEILGLPSRNNQATVHEDEVDTFWGSIWLTPSIFSYDLYYFISLYFRISLKVLHVQKNASVGDNILSVTYHSSKFFKKGFKRSWVTLVPWCNWLAPPYTRRISFFRVLCSRHWIENMLTHTVWGLLNYVFFQKLMTFSLTDFFFIECFYPSVKVLFCHFSCHCLIMSFFSFEYIE